ncbi:MAG: DUF362 domain-containing protein [Desulfuromonadales bacterium]|nr:DUF362 domain-containing protein [Desulfuromonadales bacterium]
MMENVVGLASCRHRENNSYTDRDLVARLVREAMIAGGLGQADPAVPLADIIRPGMSVLVKPNWVYHESHSGLGMDCLVTHPAFILAVLQEVFKTNPGRVIVGDAPIQGCDFDLLVTEDWKKEVAARANCPVDIIDFRRTVLRKGGVGAGQDQDVRSEDHYVLFDLGKDSLLEPVSYPAGRFRITNYDPEFLARRHQPGRHQYLLCREPFEADVILNLPKLKTHKKAGLTAALKNLVGLNGNKEFLPHHRLGGTALGGDCYSGLAPLKRLAEYCLDQGNRCLGTPDASVWYRRARKLVVKHRHFGDTEIEGGWHGNDTVWRMALDLNRLLLYGRPDGSLSETPLRRVYSITDAIIAGERNGPLAPSPKSLGVVSFASSSAFADLVHATLMRFKPDRISLVHEAFGTYRYPLAELPARSCTIFANGRQMNLQDIDSTFCQDFRAADGWQGHVELRGEC